MDYLLNHFKFLIFIFFILSLRVNAQTKGPIKIKTQKVELSEIYDNTLYPGLVMAQEESIQLSHIDGIVRTINISLGQSVKKNEILMEIGHFDPGRQGGTFKVLSSIDGVVGSMNVTMGGIVHTNQELSKVINPHKLKVRLEVVGPDIPLIKSIKDGEMEIHKKKYKVLIHSISPMLDQTTGTASVDLRFEKNINFDNDIPLVGSIGMVRFKADFRKAIKIPNKLVNYDGTNYFVKIADFGKKRAIKKTVTLGLKINDQVEILKGLTPGEDLIVFSSEYVKESDEIELEK